MVTVIVGLGNKGREYENSRHNVGRELAIRFAEIEKCAEFKYQKKSDALVTSGVLQSVSVKIVLPETMMNHSGKSISYFIHSENTARRLVVLRDDLDLPIGTIKMSFGHSSGGHKGVESIMNTLKTKNFTQLKVGISSTTPGGKLRKPTGDKKVISHVLGKFSEKERKCLEPVFTRAHEVLMLFISSEIEKAMQVANSK